MRILFFGDIMGRSGRDGVIRHLPDLVARHAPDFIVANGENAAGGFGITLEIARDLFAAGVDCITLGNHSWDQKPLLTQIDAEPRLLRPINYPPGTPGRGAQVYTKGQRKLLVINVMGRLFMDPLDDPFRTVEAELARHRLGGASSGTVGGILVDIHAEATSEKMAMAQYLDGRVSLVVGSHSHIPTADAQILPGGTAYQTDAGMCGDYDSVIGMKKELSLHRFLRKTPGERMAPAEGEATVCAVLVETDDATGKAMAVRPIRRGGRLHPAD